MLIYWRAGAVTIWAPQFRRYCATRTASGGDGEYSGNNDAQLDLINVFYYWASGGMYVPGVIDVMRASPLGKLFRPENLVNYTRG